MNSLLPDVLLNRRWIRRMRPFRHVIAEHVFTADYYTQLSSAFYTVLRQGLSEGGDSRRLTPLRTGDDAYGLTFTDNDTGPFSIFMSSEWRRLIAAICGISATKYVHAGLHHHKRGSKDGQVHNDLNPGWFLDREASPNRSDSMCSALYCDYTTGTVGGLRSPLTLSVVPVQVVRAVTVIVYLSNPPWHSGDGGKQDFIPMLATPVPLQL